MLQKIAVFFSGIFTNFGFVLPVEHKMTDHKEHHIPKTTPTTHKHKHHTPSNKPRILTHMFPTFSVYFFSPLPTSLCCIFTEVPT
jgi:hypothetical protein